MKRFRKILYLCEAGGDQDAALARAVTLAEVNQATLTVLDQLRCSVLAVKPPGFVSPISVRD